MRASLKKAEALRRRIRWWDDMPSQGQLSTMVKISRENGMAYHKPGSQNRKKGSGRKGTK